MGLGLITFGFSALSNGRISVGALVLAQMTLAAERFGADVARERFDSAVQFQMGLAVLFTGEAFVTDGTLVGLLARM